MRFEISAEIKYFPAPPTDAETQDNSEDALGPGYYYQEKGTSVWFGPYRSADDACGDIRDFCNGTHTD
jgi:hypothetical protein